MEKIKFIHDYEIEPLLCDYFDMICGTSTGGYDGNSPARHASGLQLADTCVASSPLCWVGSVCPSVNALMNIWC